MKYIELPELSYQHT